MRNPTAFDSRSIEWQALRSAKLCGPDDFLELLHFFVFTSP